MDIVRLRHCGPPGRNHEHPLVTDEFAAFFDRGRMPSFLS